MLKCNGSQVFRWALFLLPLAWVTVSMILPNTSLAWLRSEFRWIGQPINWVESLWPAVDLMHVLLFALLGLMARLAFPLLPLRVLIVGLALFAMTSEVVQFWVPGRTPLVSDFVVDMVGALVGIFSGALCIIWWRRFYARQQVK